MKKRYYNTLKELREDYAKVEKLKEEEDKMREEEKKSKDKKLEDVMQESKKKF